MKRFETMKKSYSSKAQLKMAGGDMHPPPSPGSFSVPGQLSFEKMSHRWRAFDDSIVLKTELTGHC